jgi:hypothetical protein
MNNSSDVSQDILLSASRIRDSQLQKSLGDVNEGPGPAEGSPRTNLVISANKSITSSEMH